uniref:Uncharacterized protein n=1 Tax=Aegilops tauschii subsp. strangulata TaxID=200361 RepID=A0A453KTM1_AEGTS
SKTYDPPAFRPIVFPSQFPPPRFRPYRIPPPMAAVVSDLVDFLNASPTAFHAVG